MKNRRFAVPSNNPGGLDALRSDHFGHCDVFTIVDINANSIVAVEELANMQHEPGGCLAPVTALQDKGVEAIVVGGIGGRPLQGFNAAGILVYYADSESTMTVQKVVEGMISGEFPVIQQNQTCQNHGNCH